MKSIVVLASGAGSNLRAIVQACAAERWPARIAGVVANRRDAPALAWAREQALQTALVEHAAHPTRDAFDAELARAVDAFAPDVVALAGFMRVLGDAFVERYAGRLINVHPSLLPAFPGLATHRRVLEAGCKLSGATVHFVASAVDCGPIVMQAAVPVPPGDTAETLAARVLAVEHRIYPRALRWLVEGRLRVDAGIVTQLDGEAQWLLGDGTR